MDELFDGLAGLLVDGALFVYWKEGEGGRERGREIE